MGCKKTLLNGSNIRNMLSKLDPQILTSVSVPVSMYHHRVMRSLTVLKSDILLTATPQVLLPHDKRS